VGGEPLPDVLWRRTASGGNMPLGKRLFRILNICNLIQHTQTSHAANVCMHSK